ncbi:MAG: DUF547 domain-containing protein [Mariprofundaceae bacterium]
MFKTLLIALLLLALPAQAEEPDWSNYAGLLSDYVIAGEKHGIQLNLVNYQAWSKDARWPTVLNDLKIFDVARLEGKKEQLAFWVNVYNVLAIKMVLDHRPVESIRDIGNVFSPVWKKDVAIIAGKIRSLHEVEHDILRPMGEARIHFAIVCASVSCPDLLQIPYRGEQLQVQLQQQTVKFIQNQGKGIYSKPGDVRISKIFDWFEEDFSHHGSVQSWLATSSKAALEGISGYLPYDWSLNIIK